MDIDLSGVFIYAFWLYFIGFSVSFLIFQCIFFLTLRRKLPSFRSLLLSLSGSIGLGLLFSAIYIYSLFLPFLDLIIIVIVVGIFYLLKRYKIFYFLTPIFWVPLVLSVIIGRSILPIQSDLEHQKQRREYMQQEEIKKHTISQYKVIAIKKTPGKENSLDFLVSVPKTSTYVVSIYAYFSSHLNKGEIDMYKYPREKEPIYWVSKLSLYEGMNTISVPLQNNFSAGNNKTIDIEVNVGASWGNGVSFYSPNLANCFIQLGLACTKDDKLHFNYY